MDVASGKTFNIFFFNFEKFVATLPSSSEAFLLGNNAHSSEMDLNSPTVFDSKYASSRNPQRLRPNLFPNLF